MMNSSIEEKIQHDASTTQDALGTEAGDKPITNLSGCEGVANDVIARLERLKQNPERFAHLDEHSRGFLEREISRRHFLAGSMVVAGTVALANVPSAVAQDAPKVEILPEVADITLNVNGQPYALQLDTRTSLLDAVRETLGLTGAKKGCNQGTCGACTVHINGQRVVSCLTLAVTAQGTEVTTVEGLAQGDTLHPLQQAFIRHDAFQCGYCTSGQIMSGVACIAEGNAASEESIREFMSGNICRCSAYPGIVAAIQETAQRS
ncbi:MAG: 2Fe-2S iron-sulfur cluster-binding protein [Trueperaceae bacterium]